MDAARTKISIVCSCCTNSQSLKMTQLGVVYYKQTFVFVCEQLFRLKQTVYWIINYERIIVDWTGQYLSKLYTYI